MITLALYIAAWVFCPPIAIVWTIFIIYMSIVGNN